MTLNTTAAWVGGLDGSCRIIDAVQLPTIQKRFIDSLISFEEAFDDKSFASPVIEALASCYAVVAELYGNKRSTQMDNRLERAINQLVAIDSDNVQMKKQLNRMRECNDRHAGLLHGGEVLARLLMEVRRIQQATEHIEVCIREYLQTLTSWRLASDCAQVAWIEETVLLDQDPQGQHVYWAKSIDYNGRAILGDHHEAIDPSEEYIIIAPSLAITEALPKANGDVVGAASFICEHGIFKPPYAKEFEALETDGYTDSLV